MLRKESFDFSQFDPETVDLYLCVAAAYVVQVVAVYKSRQIAGLIHSGTRSRLKRVRDKSLSTKLGPIKVSASHACATDIDLAHNSRRYGPLFSV